MQPFGCGESYRFDAAVGLGDDDRDSSRSGGMTSADSAAMDPENTDRIWHVIETRHSSRGPFDPAWHVTEPELARIIDAARSAPTAHNMQNFRLIAVDDPMVLAERQRRSCRAFALETRAAANVEARCLLVLH